MSSQEGTRIPQGLVRTRTSTTTLASMARVTALAAARNAPCSSSVLSAGIPTRLPDNQADLSTR
ncbi:hypothetical protein ACFY0N_24930 [Streptomyces vinaceus]|uniref:hypothetical protein n=1 Tax=Streptomyces vinaceus TaxID=1960 RepID=UPI003696997C